MATVNPPKKHKYPVQTGKKMTKSEEMAHKIGDFFFLNKKKILLITAAVLAAAMLITALAVGLNYYFIDTPYDGLRFADHITLPDYFGMELSQAKVEEEFKEQKRDMLKTLATFEPRKSGIIEEGDNVTVSTEGFIVKDDGTLQKVAVGTLTDYEITDIGNHITESGAAFSDDIQDAIIGTSVLAVKKVTADVKYPDDYLMEELKGKTVRYFITVSKVTKTILPEYTDAVVSKATSTFSTIEAYEKYTYNSIKQNLLWNELVKGTTVKKYPEKYIEMYEKEYDDYYNAYMSEKKVTFEALLAELGITGDEYKEARTEYAQNTVKEEMMLYFIIKTEKIRISSSEYDTACEMIAADNGYSSVEEMLKGYGEDIVERTVYWEKVKGMIVDSSVAVD